MIKVNTAKISPQDFADKYNLNGPVQLDGYYASNDGRLAVHPDSSIWLFSQQLDMETSQEPATVSLLFDMIANGDVVKEANK